MSRPPKRKRHYRPPKRVRPLKTSVLIVCEGKTETNYFDKLKRDEVTSRRFAVTVKRGKGGSRDQIAQFAIERMNEGPDRYDFVWCVMDVEGPDQADAAAAAMGLLKNNSIEPCFSNPAFEVWLLSHFEKTGTAFPSGDAVVKRLARHWSDYDKTGLNIYPRVAALTDTAIQNAKWVRENHHGIENCVSRCNSATDVYRLVAFLRRVTV